MSAFIMRNEAIGIILSAMHRHWDKCGGMVPRRVGKKGGARLSALSWLGNELMRMNVESVNHRYNEHTRFRRCDYAPFVRETIGDAAEDVAAVKEIACWMYQSCEMKDYEERWQWAVMERLAEVLAGIALQELGVKSWKGEAYDILRERDEWDKAPWD